MPAVVALIAAAALAPSVAFDHMTVFGPFNSGGRTPCPVDPIAYQMVEDTFKAPKVGDQMTMPDGKKLSWADAKADKDGWIEGRELGGGYAFAEYESDKAKTMLLDASGHSMVYVNGAPRAGDPYGFGFVQLPVSIKMGKNELLFSVGRGRVRASLTDISTEVTIRTADPTFPDVIVGEPQRLLCSVLLMNSTSGTFVGRIRGSVEGTSGTWSDVRVTPMTVKKVSFWLEPVEARQAGQVDLKVELGDTKSSGPISTQGFKLDVKTPDQVHKRTFYSSVDRSVQYYAVQPASVKGAKAMVMSLHGAGVEATGQAASYGQKPWCNIVCPTNGRPYGFDWEDWGRINALDALADAKKVFSPDPDKVYLTGHSMGGHGTWSIGFNHPDLFAAIAPCAGWISFWSYAGAADWKEPDAVEKLLRRAANPSDTLLLLNNAKELGIYIQHGDKDDNVPVEQAREMRERLGKFHKDFDWHEEPGQSHWFDTDPEAGANVQDYAPLFDFLAKHRIRNEAERRYWDLTTVNLNASHSVANVGILAQAKAAEPSRVQIRTYADQSFEEVTSTNVYMIVISALGGRTDFKLKLDNQDFDVKLGDQTAQVYIKSDSGWQPQSPTTSHIVRYLSPQFKSCLGRSAVFGTRGSRPENEWSYNKARYDAETWWYRGNGSMDLSPDTEWVAVAGMRDWKGITLYGNEDTNSAIKSARTITDTSVKKTTLKLAGRDLQGDLGLLTVIHPERDMPAATIGVIGGTTLKGCRSTDRLPIFLSGVHYADVFVNTPEMYLKGSKGVKMTGFYGPDWSAEKGEFAVRD